MEIKCFYGHIQIGREAKPCKECINTERTMYRTFKRARGSQPDDPAVTTPQNIPQKEKKEKSETTSTGIKRRRRKPVKK
jgi:hypothetical protein